MAQDSPADSTNDTRVEVLDTTHRSVVLQAGANDSSQAAAGSAFLVTPAWLCCSKEL